MLIEGVKLSDGTILPFAVDDDGKLLVGGVSFDGTIIVGDVEIVNAAENPVPVAGTVAVDNLAASIETLTDKIDELIALLPTALTTAGNLKVSIEEDKTLA